MTEQTEMTDSDRINWLEKMARKPGGILLHDGTEKGRFGLGLWPGSIPYSLRHLIDFAASVDRDSEERSQRLKNPPSCATGG